MPSFFVEPALLQSDAFDLDEDDSRHVAGALRMRVGDEITVFDGSGGRIRGRIEELEKRRVRVAVIERDVLPPSLFSVILLQGLPKSGKFDLIVEKATELGVEVIVPLLCERTVVELGGEKGRRRRERWQRIALEASKQCGRPTVPLCMDPIPFADALRVHAQSIGRLLLPWEEEAGTWSFKGASPGGTGGGLSAPPISSELIGGADSVGIIVGPEGGITDTEAGLARECGAIVVSLGPSILRTETAAIASLTLVTHFLRELKGSS